MQAILPSTIELSVYFIPAAAGVERLRQQTIAAVAVDVKGSPSSKAWPAGAMTPVETFVALEVFPEAGPSIASVHFHLRDSHSSNLPAERVTALEERPSLQDHHHFWRWRLLRPA